MDSTKAKSKANREEKQATAKLDEQIEKVCCVEDWTMNTLSMVNCII